MIRAYFVCAPVLLAFAGAGQAADNSFTANASGTDYSKAFGSRRDMTVEATTDLGATAFTIGVSHGKRKFDAESHSAVRLTGTVYHDWSDRFYTRTFASISSDKPVYATREIANDFNYKALPNAVLTIGGKIARYADNRDARSWSGGASYYFPGGFATYRFTAYDVDRLGKSHGHLATVRIKDGKRGIGSTQLWLGSGSSLHEEEVLLTDRRGNFRSVALQRVQPIKGPLSLHIAVGRTWYDIDTAKYQGTKVTVGLALSDWKALR